MQRPSWLVRLVVRVFAWIYRINVAEAAKPLHEYVSLLDFFLRTPVDGSRPIDSGSATVVSPVDALVAACGTAAEGTVVLVKGHHASLGELTGGLAEPYEGGGFLMLYLSPADIHRIYAPCDAAVQRSWRIEGALRSVAPGAVARHPRTFVENRRVLTELASAVGRVLMVKVGARNVGRIVTHHPVPCDAHAGLSYKKGEELGWFELGSTVILMFEKGKFRLAECIAEGSRVKIGQAVARFNTA